MIHLKHWVKFAVRDIRQRYFSCKRRSNTSEVITKVIKNIFFRIHLLVVYSDIVWHLIFGTLKFIMGLKFFHVVLSFWSTVCETVLSPYAIRPLSLLPVCPVCLSVCLSVCL